MAPAANASTVSYDTQADVVRYGAGEREVNVVRVRPTSNGYEISDEGYVLNADGTRTPLAMQTTSAHCISVSAARAVCSDPLASRTPDFSGYLGDLGDDLRPDLGMGSGSSPTWTVDGGEGNDQIRAGGENTLAGGAGDDRLESLATYLLDDSTQDGGPGDDHVQGGQGWDELRGGAGDDVILGERGGDWLFGEDGADKLNGQHGYDRLNGGMGPDRFEGPDEEPYSDYVVYSDRTAPVRVTLDGEANDGEAGEGDFLASGIWNLYAGKADDVVGPHDAEAGRVVVVYGDDGNDVLTAGPSMRNRIGGGGSMNGGRGNDVLTGGPRPEILTGDASAGGYLLGEDPDDGADRISGGGGDDLIFGGSGPYADLAPGDHLVPGTGADKVYGGPGDVADYGERTAPVFVEVSTDRFAAGVSGEQGEGDLLYDFEEVRGGSADDRLIGHDDPNRLLGGPGNDRLEGRGGSDVLDGQAGIDGPLSGGDGDDRLFTRDREREPLDGVPPARCGAGDDTVFADGFDLFDRDCESRVVRPPPG